MPVTLIRMQTSCGRRSQHRLSSMTSAVICFGPPTIEGTLGCTEFDLQGSGDVTQSNHVWRRDDVGAFVPVTHGRLQRTRVSRS